MAEPLRVFISSAHSDQDFTRRFVSVLHSAGIDTWFDEHDLAAGNLLRTIEREISSRPIFIPILSPGAIASSWVGDEVRWAYNLNRRDPTRIILPVVAAPLTDDDIWLFLSDFKRIEGPNGQPYSPEEAAQRVLRAFGLISGSAQQERPEPEDQNAEDVEGAEDLITRGKALRANGHLAEALDIFAEASQRAPRTIDTWTNYGLALAEANRFEEALTAFSRALTLDPTSELALRSLGDTLLASGRYLEAVTAYDRALAHNRTYVTAWYNRGTALLALRNFEAAVENYRMVQELDPRNSDAYMFQADALWQVGRRREALDAYEQAIELKPGSLGDLTRPIRTLIRRYH